jgi:hypothetical protein
VSFALLKTSLLRAGGSSSLYQRKSSFQVVRGMDSGR